MSDNENTAGRFQKSMDERVRQILEAMEKTHPGGAKGVNWEEIVMGAIRFGPVVELVYNGQETVQKLRIWNDDEFQDLELGKVYISIDEGEKLGEGTVHGYVHDKRHGEELKWSTEIRHFSMEIYRQGNELLKQYVEKSKELSREKKQETDALRKWMLTPIVHSFLLTHPDSHPELARLYRDGIFPRLRQVPELRGHFNVPEKPKYEAEIYLDDLPFYDVLTITGGNGAVQRLNELNDKPNEPPWRSWLPQKVQFLRDEVREIYAIRTVKEGEQKVIHLHKTIVRARELKAEREGYEWSVHADSRRDAEAAKATICLIQQSLDLLKVYPGRHLKEGEQLTHHPLGILGVVVACFLLVDPICHAELIKLYDPKVIEQVKAMPDLRGQIQ